ncbi:MAG: iron ABC transporter permease [Granulosicoccaceae bacterium]|jgi:iron complex transport system permease protein
MPATRLLLLLILLLLAAFALSLLIGSVALEPGNIIQALFGSADTMTSGIIQELRLPRALAAFAVGGLLALAGVLMQVLLRNPLADPYILGISGGAGVAVLLALLAGIGGGWLHGAAFGGALASMLLVFALAHGKGCWTPTRLLLTGVVLAFGWGALISLLLVTAAHERLPGMLFWLIGDLGGVQQVWPALLVLLLGLVLAWPLARTLNVMAHGELRAASLGVNTDRTRRSLYVLASLLTATAVTLAGSIGFIGLVIPHLLRLLGARDHRVLLPASVLAGGTLLLLADALARSLLGSQQLPVGVLTALLGVPLFLYLLRSEART